MQTDIEKQQYYQQLRKALKPKQAALFLPNYFKRQNKRRVVVVIAICVFSTLSFLVKDIIVKIQHNELTYYYLFDQVVITGGYGENIVIPDIIDGREVTKISQRAFYNNANLKTLIISEGVKEIGTGAFNNCPNLEYVKLPSTINKVRNAPFQGCNKIKYFINNSPLINSKKFLGENYEEEMLEITFTEPQING